MEPFGDSYELGASNESGGPLRAFEWYLGVAHSVQDERGGQDGLERKRLEVLDAIAVVRQPGVTQRRRTGRAEQSMEHLLATLIAQRPRSAWDRDEFILIGYSLGADVLPFMANRLPADLLDRVNAIVLIGPSHEVDFQFHLTDWLATVRRKDDRPVLPEVRKLSGRTILCFHGSAEKNSLCADLEASLARTIDLPGGHRVGHRFEAIADTIIAIAQ